MDWWWISSLNTQFGGTAAAAAASGNDNLLRAEFISGKNLLESLPKENFSSQRRRRACAAAVLTFGFDKTMASLSSIRSEKPGDAEIKMIIAAQWQFFEFH